MKFIVSLRSITSVIIVTLIVIYAFFQFNLLSFAQTLNQNQYIGLDVRPTSQSSDSQIDTITVGGTQYGVYVSGSGSQSGGLGIDYYAVPISGGGGSNRPACFTNDPPVVTVYDVNIVTRSGQLVPNNQVKTNVPYRIQTILENSSCLATNDVLSVNTGLAEATFVNYINYNSSAFGWKPNTYYRNRSPEGVHGAFPVSTLVDMAATGYPNISSRVNRVGPLGRNPIFAGNRDYSRVVPPSQITSTRNYAVQKPRNELAANEGGFTVSGNRATVYSPEFTLTTTGAGTIRAEADPNLGLSNGWILPRGSHVRTENISVQTANLVLGSMRITNDGFAASNANTPRDYEYGDQVGIWWNGTNIDYSTCVGRMTRTDGTPLSDFNGRRDTAGYSSSRLALLPSNTNPDRVDLNITEPNPNQAHAYTMTCDVLGGGKITRTIRIEMGPIPVSTTVTPGLQNVYAYPGAPVTSIPFTVRNDSQATVTNFRYELDVRNAQYRYAGVNPANLGRGQTRTYTAANASYVAPGAVGTYPMALRVYLPNTPATNFAQDTATLHVVQPRYSVRVPAITVDPGALIPQVNFGVTNTDTRSDADNDILGYRYDVYMGRPGYTSYFHHQNRWSVIIPKDGSVDDVARRTTNNYRAPSTPGTYTNHIRVCVYTTGIYTPICGFGNLTVRQPATPFPLSPVVTNASVTLGNTLNEINFTVRNNSSLAHTGFRYTTTISGQSFTPSTTSNHAFPPNGTLPVVSRGSFMPSRVGLETIEVCLTPLSGTGRSCNTATLTVSSSTPPTPPTPPTFIQSFTVTPELVRYNSPATVSYTVIDSVPLACNITGGLTYTFNTGTGDPVTNSIPSQPLISTQRFVLTCIDAAGNVDTAISQAGVAPFVIEI